MAIEMSPDTDDGGAIKDCFKGIEPGMEVENLFGERIGNVTYVYFVDPLDIELWSHKPGMPGQRVALELEATLVPDVPANMADRLLRSGYILIDDKRRFRRDHHYYAMPEDIASVEAGTVHLCTMCDDLVTTRH